MTRTILVAGTASHVGKSTVAAGLCRALADAGVSVAPFKAQNMSNNARVALSPNGDWGEIGVSQYVQARAARVPPTTDMNPVLLKPRGDGQSQLVIQGEPVGNFEAGAYYESGWQRARAAAEESFARLAAERDVIVAEGAGSIAEINLAARDLANRETAQFADADILLLGDIERGGVFASLYGTLELMPADLRERVVGTAITKFRGDPSLLDSGLEGLEARTDIPCLGVLPYDDPGLPEEDSVSLPVEGELATWGADDGVSESDAITIAVPRLPRISNFTDLEPLAAEPGVRIAFLPLDSSLSKADAVVLPGTKNTVDDLLALRGARFDERLRAFDGPVVGICGGFQMLGERLTNVEIESTSERGELPGVALLPVTTEFRPEKRVTRATVTVDGDGLLAGASGSATGYEIHMGRTTAVEAVSQPLGPESAATDRVLGTYLHGLFENESVRSAFVTAVFEATGKSPPGVGKGRTDPADRAARLVTEQLDAAFLDSICR
ncbi:cobyric acid synthase [Haladaptatus sp. DYSN1]|uniref:cobyric acid synthase n=1 Tax=unclassified Haladaptatus TaxID=2622732 RepID=UPI002405D2B2|nr:cobyric acid synthase [Haladaptatus sp. DYSN1]